MKLFVTFGIIILIITTITNLGYLSVVNADRDKDFCYDQVGDGHFCFEKVKRCEKAQKHDEIAESPCYNQDRN
jgi:hypothetical protein